MNYKSYTFNILIIDVIFIITRMVYVEIKFSHRIRKQEGNGSSYMGEWVRLDVSATRIHHYLSLIKSMLNLD